LVDCTPSTHYWRLLLRAISSHLKW
jgi:hypothetical protein